LSNPGRCPPAWFCPVHSLRSVGPSLHCMPVQRHPVPPLWRAAFCGLSRKCQRCGEARSRGAPMHQLSGSQERQDGALCNGHFVSVLEQQVRSRLAQAPVSARREVETWRLIRCKLFRARHSTPPSTVANSIRNSCAYSKGHSICLSVFFGPTVGSRGKDFFTFTSASFVMIQ
jgi:hypothetical protein